MSQAPAPTVLVTGGCGFIGSALVRMLLADPDAVGRLVNLDALTYAASPEAVAQVSGDSRYRFEQGDIRDGARLGEVLRAHRPDAIVHLAAESHVDRSIDAPAAFVETNVLGTCALLDAALEYWRGLGPEARSAFRFLHVSTDEVFGSLGPEGVFGDAAPYAPSSPYAASKASSDHFVRAWHKTYGLPVLITHGSNSYGPYQFPEKLVPHMVLRCLEGSPLPVYGDGRNVRDWLHVDDHARALRAVLSCGRVGHAYPVGGECERETIEVVRAICRALDELLPASPHRPHERLIRFVADRPGHDARYALDIRKTRRELSWEPRVGFEDGLAATVRWYVDRRDWWGPIRARRYDGERLGLR